MDSFLKFYFILNIYEMIMFTKKKKKDTKGYKLDIFFINSKQNSNPRF